MTLGGLTVVIGVLIDHAIVVIERAMRNLSALSSPQEREQVALEASSRILMWLHLFILRTFSNSEIKYQYE